MRKKLELKEKRIMDLCNENEKNENMVLELNNNIRRLQRQLDEVKEQNDEYRKRINNLQNEIKLIKE